MTGGTLREASRRTANYTRVMSKRAHDDRAIDYEELNEHLDRLIEEDRELLDVLA